ncbi:Two-component response regulator, AmiR/NasT family, consists of REC and RNA-binding antiterminator (ANTAR) domains [Methylobacterium sp. 190mf]|uniref:ANTAR domain-containing response regulator n=1 Tax=Methylobacterium sp. 190mf TaxID=1761798 RepID=UPI00089E9DB6|nr:ANTAR domain-containing protein [Methylobacterium sp. 190mf]SEG66788.1 Two-component response regulator, AmiR/NasT family, consists of REC and RNA-binding antiterminator (ANTAR) domains [Methylobacterium sp. 190mf]
MTSMFRQNFRGMRGHIFAQDGGGVETLVAVLTKLGLEVQRHEASDAGFELEPSGLRPESDVLFVDGDVDRVLTSDMLVVGLPPAAVIGLVGVEAPSRLKALMVQGATAFLRKPIYAGAVYTALVLGINQYLQRKTVADELEEHQDRRRRRRSVIKAVVRLMAQQGLNDDEAYAVLRRDSMSRQLSLEEYCERYLTGGAESNGISGQVSIRR